MADLLSALFGSNVSIPQAVTVNPAQAAQQAGSINATAASNFGSYAPQLTNFIQSLFNSAYPQVNQALNTNTNLGTQLATTGTTSAMTNAMNYYRQLGLQTAAATGAPVSSAFSQNLGGSLGVQQILQNQLQGSSVLSGVAGQAGQLGMSMLQPSFGVLSSSLTTPGQIMSTDLQNAQMQNQQNVLGAQYASQANPAAAWMINDLSTILNNLGGIAGGAGIMGALA